MIETSEDELGEEFLEEVELKIMMQKARKVRGGISAETFGKFNRKKTFLARTISKKPE